MHNKTRMPDLPRIGAIHANGQAVPTLIHSQVLIPSGPLEIAPEERRAITLEDAPEVFRAGPDTAGYNPNPIEAAFHVCEILRSQFKLHRSHEHLFLLLYFDRVIEKLASGSTLRGALLPLPKARFSTAGDDQTSVTADFAFWTGRRFIAAFIRESRFDEDCPEERLLKLWGFEVYRLMADQLETRGLATEAGAKLLDALWLL
jgi:hypothetical protein